MKRYLFIISLGATIGISNLTRPKEVAIPDLIGKTVDEAKQILEEDKLIYVEGEPEYSADYEAGKIISQDPPYVENRKIRQKTEVKVIVSLGTETTTVPKLTGLTQEEAEDAAEEAKIKLEIIEETSKTVEAGIIIKQEIEEGETVNAGDTVKVYVSIGTGIEQVVVTSVFGKTEEVAKQTLTDLGLEVIVEYEEDNSKDNGIVLKQSISSGETVDKGSKITITVNKRDELKNGTVTINVKSITGYKDKIKETDDEGNETEKNNTPKDVTLRVTVNDEQVENTTVKENVTNKTVNVSGRGTITIKVYIDGSLKKTVEMNLNNTTTLTIE